jgi:hypothetical protein
MTAFIKLESFRLSFPSLMISTGNVNTLSAMLKWSAAMSLPDRQLGERAKNIYKYDIERV